MASSYNQKPVYTGINSSSIYTSYGVENNQHVFTVEPGNRFYLKLNLTANPWPKNDNLSKNGSVLQRVQWAGPGTINLGVDSVNIQSAQFSDAGKYVISCSNLMGEARFPFLLKVERQYQRPVYNGIDFSSSTFTNYAFENSQHVLTVEQGTRFYLKLNLTANPPPTSDSLSKNGTVLQRSPWGNITLGVDSVDIQSVRYTDTANYTISCSNSMGSGSFSFRLNVVATHGYKQLRRYDLRDQDYDPSV